MTRVKVHRTPESSEYFFKEGCHILELHNDPEDPGLSIARARVEAGQSTRLHVLDGLTERYLILAGEGRVEIGDHSSAVQAGSVAVIPPGCSQRVHNTGTGDLIFLALCTPRFSVSAYRCIE